jgi:hypothetical protein
VVSAGIGYLIEEKEEMQHSTITVGELLAQAGGGEIVSNKNNKNFELRLSITGDHLDELQISTINNFARELIANNIRGVEVHSGSEGNSHDLVSAFYSFQYGKEIAKIFEGKGIDALVRMSPERVQNLIEIIPVTALEAENA